MKIKLCVTKNKYSGTFKVELLNREFKSKELCRKWFLSLLGALTFESKQRTYDYKTHLRIYKYIFKENISCVRIDKNYVNFDVDGETYMVSKETLYAYAKEAAQ